MNEHGSNASVREQLSSLFGSYKAEWLKDDIFALFAEPSYFPELVTNRPCVLVGGRGTGKTTVLRGLSYQGQFALAGGRPESVASWKYIGLYYRVNTNHVTAFKGHELPDEMWTRLFGHYFNMVICGLVLEFLEWHRNLCPGTPDLTTEQCERIAAGLHLPSSSSCRELSQHLDLARVKFQAHLNSIADGEPFPLSMQEAPIGAIATAALSLPPLSGKQFFILIDEYENFEDYQQQVVNTLIKHATPEYTFKIGVRETGWRQRTTLNVHEKLIDPSDYVIIPIVDKLEGERFKAFAKQVCRSRMSRIEEPCHKVILDMATALPSLSEDDEAVLLGVQEKADAVRDELKQHFQPQDMARFDGLPPLYAYLFQFWATPKGSSLSDMFRSFLSNETEWNTRYDNYKHALLYTLRRGKRGIHKYYCGWDTFTQLAGGNIRYLLELVDYSYLQHLEKKGTLEEPIPPAVQTCSAQAVGEKNVSELEGILEGANLTKLLLGLGRIFQVMASQAEGHAPEVNQFYLNVTDPGSSIASEVTKLMRAAVMHLVLIRAPGNKLAGEGATKDYDYMVHPIFSAFFEVSYRRKRKMSIEDREMIGLVSSPKATIRQILDRNHRFQDDVVPDQLVLFKGYYDGRQ